MCYIPIPIMMRYVMMRPKYNNFHFVEKKQTNLYDNNHQIFDLQSIAEEFYLIAYLSRCFVFSFGYF